MSQIKVNSIVDANSGNTVSINGVTPTAQSLQGFRNRIINGDMRVWQRGTSFSGMTPSLGVTAYAADRWFVAQLTSQSATDVSQQTSGATRFAIRVQKRVGSGGASTNILGQVIENLNCLDLPGQSVTLSFTARAGANYSASGNALAVQLFTCTTADQSSASFINGTAAGQATLLSENVTLTTSNQRFTITTGAIPTNATNLCLTFNEASSASASGANDWFEISDVQIEAGSVATPFERRPYGNELQLCQRYFEVLAGTSGSAIYGSTANVGYVAWYFKTTKRATPTLTFAAASNIIVDFTSADAVSGYAVGYPVIRALSTSSAEL